MAYKKRCRESYKMLATGTGAFKKDDGLIGRAVEMHAADTVKLAADNAKIKGSIEGFDSGQVIVIVEGEDVPFKNSGTTAIGIGSAIVGATRTIVASGDAQLGYVKAAPAVAGADVAAVIVSANNALKGRGQVVNGGAANTANTDVAADVKVSLPRG